ncbi:MAG: arginine--tRNA ligase [Gammaproteobacteria bacterium]|jgi:arginyl-tRNA synthetase|nr:arginine--tRNA ligase [Gammaproteobacteria bacterium]
MKSNVQAMLSKALDTLVSKGVLPSLPTEESIQVERTRDPGHGDFASNCAMTLCKSAGMPPRDLAQQIVDALPGSHLVQEVTIAGPGFINFRFSATAWQAEIRRVLEEGPRYGTSQLGLGKQVLVEFVSANPTGPLHVGHGRHAAYGASLANLLDAVGFNVRREYYVNDAGRQMQILGLSVWLRYLELQGVKLAFPENAYRGDYVLDISRQLQEQHGDALVRDVSGLPSVAEAEDKESALSALIAAARDLLGEDNFRSAQDLALNSILDDIRDDLSEFGVVYDRWYSEHSLAENGAIDRALQKLQANNHTYVKGGATWFRASDLGDEKDRVVIRENGQTTYFASDIAYHLDKRERGFDLLLDVLGADHHGYVARVRAGLEAMGEPPASLEVKLVQFVSLFRAGKKEQMSTRSGQFVTLRQLRDEVGNDAARLIYVMRSNDQHLDFDLELAKTQSADNPVYYIQYAHARVASVARQLQEKGYRWDPEAGLSALHRLDNEHEAALMKTVTRYPETVELAAVNRAPHMLVHYLRELANDFHTYYNAHQFIVTDQPLRDARLSLVNSARQVIANGLGLLGVSAPDNM